MNLPLRTCSKYFARGSSSTAVEISFDTRQRMKDAQRILCISQLVRRQDIAVLQADVVLLIEESLPLDSRHVKDVQLRHSIFQIRCL